MISPRAEETEVETAEEAEEEAASVEAEAVAVDSATEEAEAVAVDSVEAVDSETVEVEAVAVDSVIAEAEAEAEEDSRVPELCCEEEQPEGKVYIDVVFGGFSFCRGLLSLRKFNCRYHLF